jgi:hypothetical protein
MLRFVNRSSCGIWDPKDRKAFLPERYRAWCYTLLLSFLAHRFLLVSSSILHDPKRVCHSLSLLMATSMDFSYFSSGPLSYQYQTSAPEEDFRFNGYNHPVTSVSDVITTQAIHSQLQEPFNSAFSHFQESFYDPSIQPTRAPSVLQSAISPTFENGPFVSGDDGQPRSSSEDKDNAPPRQNKRKAQNRAA